MTARRLERSLAFLDAQKRLVADRTEAVDGGVALVTESLPRVWDLNLLVADPDARRRRPRAGAARPTACTAPAGLGFRKVVVRDEAAGEELAPGFAALGWTVESSAVMVHSGEAPGPRAGGRGRGAAATAAAVMAAFRRERPFGRDESVLAELAEADARYTERLGARDFAAPAGGPYGASCRLYSLEGTAEIDEVGALTEHRARGLAGGGGPRGAGGGPRGRPRDRVPAGRPRRLAARLVRAAGLRGGGRGVRVPAVPRGQSRPAA